MRKLINLITAFLVFSTVWAQPFGNEWIDYSQKYYKFGVVEDGIYRISHQILLDAGIPINSIAADKFQVFGKEKELPLFIVDNGDNSIDPGDYIEFYAQGNDGWLDSNLYDAPEDIGN